MELWLFPVAGKVRLEVSVRVALAANAEIWSNVASRRVASVSRQIWARAAYQSSPFHPARYNFVAGMERLAGSAVISDGELQ